MAATAAILACAAAAAGTIDDGVPDSRYLAYAAGFAPYTAKLECRLASGNKAFATATLIAPRWALTAAHVVEDLDCIGLVTSTGHHEIVHVVVHREWADKAGRDDLALLLSATDFGLDYYPPLATGDERPGDVVSVCGYGMTGPLSSGYTTIDGRLRAGTNTIERFENGMIICLAKRRSSPLEFCIAPGDSGGPLFCRGRLAGVNSITMRDKGPLMSREGEESGHVQVSRYREWIESVMEDVK